MVKIDYRTFSDKGLTEKLKELKLRLIQTSSRTEAAREKKEHRTRFRKELARINTEISRRKNEQLIRLG